ncbi:hypothetical protein V8G54_031500 [Vigna mungo]|uniref:Uncharacterized protein n=1 Tax=Vigna mungo TaxID=3915 RepID=A0AAQ3RGZ1_VIGMU
MVACLSTLLTVDRPVYALKPKLEIIDEGVCNGMNDSNVWIRRLERSKRYLLNKATGDIKQYVKTKLLHRQQLATFIFQGRNQMKGYYGNLIAELLVDEATAVVVLTKQTAELPLIMEMDDESIVHIVYHVYNLTKLHMYIINQRLAAMEAGSL